MAAQTLAVGQWDRSWVFEEEGTLEFDTQEFECGCWVLGASQRDRNPARKRQLLADRCEFSVEIKIWGYRYIITASQNI